MLRPSSSHILGTPLLKKKISSSPPFLLLFFVSNKLLNFTANNPWEEEGGGGGGGGGGKKVEELKEGGEKKEKLRFSDKRLFFSLSILFSFFVLKVNLLPKCFFISFPQIKSIFILNGWSFISPT